MMNEAERAVANSISFECKKDGLQQRQSGDWVLRVTVAAVDMNQLLVKAAMGTRFQCVMVEVNDDETPVEHKLEERDKWRDLGPAKQAGIRCADPMFWAFMREEAGLADVVDEETAAAAVRELCHVLTRSDLAKPGFADQRLIWFDLDNKFQAWKALEHA